MGRPRAIQGEVEKRLIYALEQGTPVRPACEYAGIDPSTYVDELARNPVFAARVRQLRVRHLPKALEEIRTSDAWQAKVRWVEMSFPNDYGRHIELAGSEGGPLKITLDFGGAAVPSVVDGGKAKSQ